MAEQWFEKIVLDGAQAGLSWLTILKKRCGDDDRLPIHAGRWARQRSSRDVLSHKPVTRLGKKPA